MKKLFAFLALVIILLLGIGFFFFYEKKQPTTESNTEQPSDLSEEEDIFDAIDEQEKPDDAKDKPIGTDPSPAPTLFTSAQIFFVALDDGGTAGLKFGCNDSAVAVTTTFEKTQAPLTAALKNLLGYEKQYYGESGLYNSLYGSKLTLSSVSITDGVANIALAGTVSVAGDCDSPRFEQQITSTALQFSTVKNVNITINGKPIKKVLYGE